MSEAAIRLHIEPLEEGGFVATSPDVPGLVAEGCSIVEVAEIAQDVARKIAEGAKGDILLFHAACSRPLAVFQAARAPRLPRSALSRSQ